MKRAPKIAISIAVGLGFVSLAASPAFAVATLPPTDTYIAMPCSSTGDPVSNLNAIASDGTSTGIGSALFSDSNCFADGSYSVTDGSYYVYDWNTSTYFRVSVTTGEMTAVGNGDIDAGPSVSVNGTFVNSNGDHYMFDSSDQSNLYKLVLGATASDPTVATLVGVLPDYISSMAYNPVSGKVYALDPYGSLYEVSLTDASEVASYPTDCNDNPWGFGVGDCWGLDFDSNGALWFQTDNGDATGNAMLASATLPANNGDPIVFVEQGVFTDATTGAWYGESTGMIVPAPTTPSLPDTGADSVALAGLLGGGAAVLVLGAALVVIRRRSLV